MRARFYMASVRAPGLVLERYARENGLRFEGDPEAWARAWALTDPEGECAPQGESVGRA